MLDYSSDEYLASKLEFNRGENNFYARLFI